jgi:multidrug efflux pump subunit AcrA (membrane-fusion protein)
MALSRKTTYREGLMEPKATQAGTVKDLATTTKSAGMQVAVDIHQGRRTVLEYLLSPVAKAVQEAGREK